MRPSEGIGFENFLAGMAEGADQSDREDFQDIHREFYAPMFSYYQKLTGDEAQAQVLTDQAFIRLFRQLDAYRGDPIDDDAAQPTDAPDPLLAWVFRQTEQYLRSLFDGVQGPSGGWVPIPFDLQLTRRTWDI